LIQEVKNEKSVNGKISYPGIIKMRAAWIESESYNFVFDYALNGDLSSFLRR
jgi:hypothetical protein